MLIRAFSCIGLLALAASAMPRHGIAQSPATVSVRAELVMPRYRGRFPDRRAVERKLAVVFAEYLTRNVGFLRFAADDSVRPYSLSFLLDRRERRASSTFAEVGFWVKLDRAGDTPDEEYWLPFRTADQSLAGVGTEVELITEVKAKLAHQDAEALRDSILRKVPISDVGLPNLNPLGLVLPFRPLDLCMKNQSVVEFLAEIRGPVTMELLFKAMIVGHFMPAAPQPADVQPFVGNAFGKVIELTPPDELSPSIRQRTVKVKKIFVLSYVHDPTACDNRAPIPVGAGAP